MPRYFKEPIEKLETRLSHITDDPNITRENNLIKVHDRVFLEYSPEKIEYSKLRYYPSKREDIVEEEYTVTIPLNHANLELISSNPINPPRGVYYIVDFFRRATNGPITEIILGHTINQINESKLYVTKEFYDLFQVISKEESRDRRIRVTSRLSPLLRSKFNLQVDLVTIDRDYSAMLREIIASRELSKEDILELLKMIDAGALSTIVIEQQINKQAEWLINTLEEIIAKDKITTPIAKELGKEHFNFPKISITGPEHLMEKILTEYGQSTLFGVPALLNTNKYVIQTGGHSKSQFDIILINHLGDIEVVELKKPDAVILEYDESRGKFYLSKDLAVAISQSERYITAVMKDNDEDYKINGKKIRDYINDEIGGVMTVESIRPTAIIIIGSWKTISKPYANQSARIRARVNKDEYDANAMQAYKEIKNSFKNIKIMTYSELLEHARTRLETTRDS